MVSAQFRFLTVGSSLLAFFSLAFSKLPAGYPGLPYEGNTQAIPGRVFLSNFDQGPREQTWHDFQNKNPWACKLRDSTGVGLQLMGQGGDKGDTKEADSLVKLRLGKCYLAETNQGDWTKYTVNVKQAGVYKLSYLSAASKTDIPFVKVSAISAKDSVGTGQVNLPITTYFHAWVYAKNLSEIVLDTGTQVLRFDIVGNGPMNIDYIDFGLTAGTGLRLENDPGLLADAQKKLSIQHLARSREGGLEVQVFCSSPAPIVVSLTNSQGKRIANYSLSRPLLGVNRISLGSLKNLQSLQRRTALMGLVHIHVQQGNTLAKAKSIAF